MGWLPGTARDTVSAMNSPSHGASQGAGACFICVTCGSQFSPSLAAPASCPICLDERQYVGHEGQEWTTLADMGAGNWRNALHEQEANLMGIGTEPKFGIGQRALLVQTAGGGNVLWECVSFLDETTIRAVRDLGGISAIAISHPHYYSSMIEWSRAFGDAPIFLHEADRMWVQRPDPAIEFWSGESKIIGDGLTLIHTGGHFEGFQVLHWRDGAGGSGALLSGDQPQVCADPRWVSFMRSYPNYIPLGAREVGAITAALEPWKFDRLYGAFWSSVVARDAQEVVRRSAERYLHWIR